ncbi:MAG TPA: hypothetical protein VFN10_11170 [Thermoanaerobaculia bacterium]|nr:hypothetical protein [Thermoanaerobaculia bacterium]
MRLAVGLVLVFLMLVLVAVSIAAWNAQHRADRAEWPANLGTLADAPKHFPARPANEAANELVKRAAYLGIDLSPASRPEREEAGYAFHDAGEYLHKHVKFVEGKIEPPPPSVAQFLSTHAEPLDALREQILHGGPIEWEVNLASPVGPAPPGPWGVRTLNRVLFASALVKASAGDTHAWDDLHASWLVMRSMWVQPELNTIATASSGTRDINALARLMSRPAPAWFEEVQTFDMHRPPLAAAQGDAWRLLHTTTSRVSLFRVMPLLIAPSVEALRRQATEAAALPPCTYRDTVKVSGSQAFAAMYAPLLKSAMMDAALGDLERESTERIMRLRSGEPASATSRCPGLSWSADGGVLRLSGEPAVKEDDMHVALELRY